MIRILSPFAFVVMSACVGAVAVPIPAPAPVPQLSAKERFVSAVENNGCVMTTDNVAVILADATIGAGDLQSIITELNAEGRAEPTGDTSIRIISDRCV